MNIALLGYGKMGKIIERLAIAKGHVIVYKRAQSREEGTLSKADVAIEFSVPITAVSNIKECIEHHIPVVSGTTGWLDDFGTITKLCEERNGSFIYASNFSIGVNLFFNMNEYLAKLMKPWEDYEVQIEEIHHTQKLDAPSGTAISIAEGILPHSNKKQWKLDSETAEDLNISAKRIEDTTGIHKVEYISAIDTISIEHQAHSREGYAKGAILAAEWLIGKQGVFTMKDVLKMN